MSSRLAGKQLLSSLRILQPLTRHYAARPEAVTDPKKEIIRRVLYPSNIRNRTTPIGTWRPDVSQAIQHAIPSVQAHNTIERAWLLHKRQIRKHRERELARKFECMRRAMEELEKIDTRLYLEANRQEDSRARSEAERQLAKTLRSSELRAVEARIRGLFPRELRVPTDTPPLSGWNYEWNSIQRPL
jgi:large subunit ribosomal protein L40